MTNWERVIRWQVASYKVLATQAEIVVLARNCYESVIALIEDFVMRKLWERDNEPYVSPRKELKARF